MAYNTLLLEIADGIALLKINRPQAMNALNQEVLLELLAAFQELEKDVNVHAIILTGEGKAFVAGAEIKEMGSRYLFIVLYVFLEKHFYSYITIR